MARQSLDRLYFTHLRIERGDLMKLDIAVSEENYNETEIKIIDNCFGFRSANDREGVEICQRLRETWFEGVLVRHWVGMAGITKIFNYDV